MTLTPKTQSKSALKHRIIDLLIRSCLGTRSTIPREFLTDVCLNCSKKASASSGHLSSATYSSTQMQFVPTCCYHQSLAIVGGKNCNFSWNLCTLLFCVLWIWKTYSISIWHSILIIATQTAYCMFFQCCGFFCPLNSLHIFHEELYPNWIQCFNWYLPEVIQIKRTTSPYNLLIFCTSQYNIYIFTMDH